VHVSPHLALPSVSFQVSFRHGPVSENLGGYLITGGINEELNHVSGESVIVCEFTPLGKGDLRNPSCVYL